MAEYGSEELSRLTKAFEDGSKLAQLTSCRLQSSAPSLERACSCILHLQRPTCSQGRQCAKVNKSWPHARLEDLVDLSNESSAIATSILCRTL